LEGREWNVLIGYIGEWFGPISVMINASLTDLGAKVVSYNGVYVFMKEKR
jgi:hypothetical protein